MTAQDCTSLASGSGGYSFLERSPREMGTDGAGKKAKAPAVSAEASCCHNGSLQISHWIRSIWPYNAMAGEAFQKDRTITSEPLAHNRNLGRECSTEAGICLESCRKNLSAVSASRA